MQIKDIHIQNLRGFEDEKIEFHPNLNVFIGSNASGKTTILEAVLNCCYETMKAFSSFDDKNLPNFGQFSFYEIKEEKEFLGVASEVSLYFDRKYYDLHTSYTKGESDSQIEWKESHQKSEKPYLDLNKNESKTLPIFCYYPANKTRIFESEEYDNKSEFGYFSFSQLEAWDNVYRDGLSYSALLEWFFQQETQELMSKRDSGDDKYEDFELALFRTAMTKVFKNLYGKKMHIKSDQIKSKHTNKLIPTLSIQEKKGKTSRKEYLESKSEGEKTIITLVADIAYNLAIAKDFENDSDEDFLKSRGVVMIDEIETHLHPNWQRKIVPILRKVFPNIQFFITTHSPQVVSSVASESVFVCEDFKVNKVNFRTKEPTQIRF